MKKLYTLFSILFIGVQVSNAQLTLTHAANNYSIGDVTNMAKYDSVTVVPKSTGAGQSWNFSNLSMGTFTETTTYTTVASTPQGASFPLATIAIMRGTNNHEYFTQSTGMVEYAGNANTNNKLVFSNLGTWNNWPVAFGNTNSDAFTALETTPTATNNWNGVISYTASGTGTVTLPGGNMHTNCLQLKKTIGIVITGSSTGTLTMTQYHYYSSASKYPILTIEYQAVASGTNTSMSADFFVNTSAMSVGINETQTSSGNFIVYPNPAIDNVNVFLPNKETPSSIEVVDMLGRTVASSDNSTSVNTNTLSKGVYSIRVKTINGLAQRPLVISE